jgi:putative MATE family efflux protein
VVGVNVLNVLALAVDTVMLSRVGNAEEALTGLGFATQLIFLLMVAMMGLVVGSVALAARAYGARDIQRVEHVLVQATTLTVIVSAIVAMFGNALAGPLLVALGAEGASYEAAIDYLRPLLTFVVFNYLTILFGAILRATGDTKTPFRVAFVMNGLNFFFNYGLILGNYGLPELGIQGAAIGTVMAQAVASLVLIGLLKRGVISGVTLPLIPPSIDVPLARKLWRVGLPAALDMVVLNAGFLAIVGMLGRLDPLAVAAHGIGLRIQALAFVPGLSISQATGAMVGNALGRGNVEEAKAVTRAGVAMCTAVMTTLSILIIAGVDPIVMLFDIEPMSDLGEFSREWMILLGLCMPLVGPYIAFVGCFRGAGATRLALRINTWTTFGIQIPGSWLMGFPLMMGAWGVWAAFPLSFMVKALWAWIDYRRGEWAVTGTEARG